MAASLSLKSTEDANNLKHKVCSPQYFPPYSLLGLIFAQQMRHSPGRTESSLVPAWLLSPCQPAGLIVCGVRQPLLTYLFLPLHFGGCSHLRSGVRAKVRDRLAPKRCVLCLNPQNGAVACVSVLNIHVYY